MAKAHGAEARKVPISCWEQLGAVLTGDVGIRVSSEPRRVVHWLGSLERAASRLGLHVSIMAHAGNGVAHAALRGDVSGVLLGGRLLRPLREELAPEGGSLVVERAPAALKGQCDVWGPISVDSQAIMARVKMQFDPDGILNPGRFVGGL